MDKQEKMENASPARSVRGHFAVPRLAFALADVALLCVSIAVAYALRFNFSVPEQHVALLPYVVPFTLAVELVLMAAFGCFKTVWRFFSAVDMPRFLCAACVSSAIFLVCRCAFPSVAIRFYPPISVNLMNLVLSVALLAGVRWFCRTLAESGRSGAEGAKRVVIAGANPVGGAIAYALRHENPVSRLVAGFIDDSPDVAGTIIQGVPVLGKTADAPRLLGEYGVDEVIVSPGGLSREKMQGLFSAATAAGARLLVAPEYSSVLDGRAAGGKLRGADITDLLRRREISLAGSEAHGAFLAGRRVMVTGAGGSIGSEIVRQSLRAGVASLVLVERCEFALFTIAHELETAPGAENVRKYVADVADEARMRCIMEKEKPEIVFHAAAYKHVPLMEENVCEAVRNNVVGTVRLARLCAATGVGNFVLLSSDKAVKPASVMGATKRLCEFVLQDLNARGGTSFSAVRFGNVLGSTGSVVPVFREQIERGGPVTVTHPEMTRYFMTIPEAVSLTIEAAAMGAEMRGRIYVLDMGEPVRITELAEKMIRLAGRRPGEDVAIAFVGVRPGEKMHEQLVAEGEKIGPTRHPQIKCCEMTPVDGAALAEVLVKFDGAIAACDDELARKLLMDFAGRGFDS